MYRHPVTGEDVPSVTNIVGMLDKPALPRWAAKVVAEEAWTLRGVLEDLDRAEAIDVLKGAPWRTTTRAMDRGTSVHDYLEARAEGYDLDLSVDALPYKAAADQFLRVYRPEFRATEFTVYGRYDYAGTADFLAVIDGALYLGDYKTSKAIYPETAMQLAAYAKAGLMTTADGTTKPMQQVAGVIAVHLTPHGVGVVEIDDIEGAYEAFLGLLRVWEWRAGGVEMSPLPRREAP